VAAGSWQERWSTKVTDSGNFIRELLNIPHDLVANHGDERFADGFGEATVIAVAVVTDSIDALHETVRKGQELTPSEQRLLVSLSDLRSEMELRLRGYWTGEPIE
jgi:hypothetical protein